MKLHRLNCYKVELSGKFAQMEMNIVPVVANNESDERNENYRRTKAQPNGLKRYEWKEIIINMEKKNFDYNIQNIFCLEFEMRAVPT